MSPDAPSALGALCGPQFMVVTVNDETGTPFSLQIYPDANNPLLRSNGLPTQYYYVPQRIYLAKKQDSPGDFDFGMTVFKGLMTSEDTIGITAAETSAGTVEAGGGFCTFSTTFAVPDSVIANAITALKNKQYAGPQAGPVSAGLFSFIEIAPTDPDPLLGPITMLSNDVTISVPMLSLSGSPQAPMLINCQNAQKGSIEAKGISSFLVTCNQLAAGAIAGSLTGGVSPFMINYNLAEQFYLPACDITVTVDIDKIFDSFSAAGSVSGFFSSASFNYAYSTTLTSGGITTDMKMNESAIPPDLKAYIEQNCQQMQKMAMDMVKNDIFDWQPTDGGPAQTSGGNGGGVFGDLFGFSASVAVKSTYQRKSIKFGQTFKLDTVVTIADTKSGDLNDLEPAIKANLGKYLAIVDIGEYFKKIQVAATNAVNWGEKLPDGTSLADPLSSVMIEVGYPDFDQPLGADGKPNLKTLGQGYHYLTGQSTGQAGLAQWTSTNPADIVNISYLRLDNDVAGWPRDQVHVRKTLIFDANDPRVDLAGGTTTVVIEGDTKDHTPVITGAEVGYIFAKLICRPIPSAVTLTLTLTLGARQDTITMNKQNQTNTIWAIFSDKYTALTSFTYSVSVQVQSPDWTDNPITYQSAQPITVALPASRVKYVNFISLQLPDVPPDQVTQINNYIRKYQLTPVAV